MKKKRIIVIAALALLIALVGGTVAYYQDSNFFENIFGLATADTEFVETFESPNNWKSCDTTPKTLVITNKSNSPVKARFKIKEYWKKNGSTDTSQTSELSMTYNGQRVAIINFQNEDDWEQEGEWYVYKNTLQKNESTSSLLASVTFNCDINFAGDVSYSADGKSGTTNITDYQSAKYHLYITAQTIAEDSEPESWSMATWSSNWKTTIRSYSSIVNFVHESTAPSGDVTVMEIQQDPSDYPIYAWLTDNNSVLHYYSQAKEIYFPSNSSMLFSSMTKLSSLAGLAGIKTTNVTNMHEMFYYCLALSNIDIVADWDVSKVTDIGYIFFPIEVGSLEPLRNWDVGSVVNMQSAFRKNFSTAAHFTTTEPISGWDVTNVRNYEQIFINNPDLDASSLEKWNFIYIRNVTNDSAMFDTTAIKPSWYQLSHY